MTAIQQVKDAIVARLNEAGLAAICAFEHEQARKWEDCVVVVGTRRAEITQQGILNYLGERYDADSGAVVEVYGWKLKLTLSLDVYAPRRPEGAAACAAAAEDVSAALLVPPGGGLELETLHWDGAAWEENYGMFLAKGTAECTAIFTAEADEESAVLTDFILKGMVEK